MRSPAQYPEIFVGATAYEGVVVILLIQFEHVIVRVEVEEERDFQFARLRGVGNLGVPVGGLANIIRGITFASPVLYANQAVGTERVSGGHIDKSMLETVFVTGNLVPKSHVSLQVKYLDGGMVGSFEKTFHVGNGKRKPASSRRVGRTF